jgi:hypothetical protein
MEYTSDGMRAMVDIHLCCMAKRDPAEGEAAFAAFVTEVEADAERQGMRAITAHHVAATRERQRQAYITALGLARTVVQ